MAAPSMAYRGPRRYGVAGPGGPERVMADFREPICLGRTGLQVGRIGLGASYGAPARAYEEAFEHGLNYFYWGSRRRDPMGDAIQNIERTRPGRLVVVLQSYARIGALVQRSVEHALRRLHLERAEVLLLGWYNRHPPPRVLGAALELQERGLVRRIALSSHHRPLFAEVAGMDEYDILHVRYNAVHRGAEHEVFPAVDRLPADRRPGIVTYTTTRWGHLCDPRRIPPGQRVPTGADCHRFVLSHPAVSLSCAGPGSLEEMRDVLRALDQGPMDPDELAWMRRVGDHVYGRDVTSGVRDGV
jgi:predicted aldo/keto reductase-like oxidoreductase